MQQRSAENIVPFLKTAEFLYFTVCFNFGLEGCSSLELREEVELVGVG